MSLYQRKKGGVWWVYIVPPRGGARFRRSTGEREKARAQRIHDELKADLWKEQRGGFLHRALDAWVGDKGATDRYHVGKLKRLIEDLPLAGLDTEALAKLIPQKTPGTYNRYVNVLSAAGVKGIKRKKPPKGRIRWLAADEWKALRAELPDWQVPMADFAIATGLRQANVFWLEWGQVDLARRRAWIHPDDAKGGEAISVPLSEAAMAVLASQRGCSEVWVFPNQHGNPTTEIKTGWKAALKRAGIAHCTWHDLRHTWATWHLMNSPPTPIEVLQKLGGWKDLRMVLRYAHLAESYVDKYAENAKPYATNHATRRA